MSKFCEKCGSELKEEAQFCYKCGAEARVVEMKEENEFVFCPECGTKVSEKYNVCPQCGTSLCMEEESPKERIEKKEKVRKTKEGKKKALVALVALLCVVGAGVAFFVIRKDGNNESKTEQKASYITYLKDDEWYIVDESGESIQFTENFYGRIKEEKKAYFEAEEYLDEEYLPSWFGGSPIPSWFPWEEYWRNESIDLYSSHASVASYGKNEVLLYLDEGREESYEYYNESNECYEIESGYVGSLYYRDMEDLEAEPELVAKEVWDFSIEKDGYISYVRYDQDAEYDAYGPQDRNYYNLATSEIVDSVERDENEIFLGYNEYGRRSLQIHKDGEDVTLEEDPDDCDETLVEEGKVYWTGKGDLYEYDIKEGENKIASDVYMKTDVSRSGDFYYVTRDNNGSTLFYYDGEESVEMESGAECFWQPRYSGRGSFSSAQQSEDISSENAIAVFALDGDEVLLIQDTLIELEGKAIRDIYVDESGNEIYYFCNKGLMYGQISGKKIKDLSLCWEQDKWSDAYDIRQYGRCGKEVWCNINGVLYVDNEEMGKLNGDVTEYDGVLYYCMDEELMAYQNGKTDVLAKDITSFTGYNQYFAGMMYQKDDEGYVYDVETKKEKEMEIPGDIYETRSKSIGMFYLTDNTGGVAYLYDEETGIVLIPDEELEYYDDFEGMVDIVGVSDLYFCNLKGELIQIDTDVLQWGYTY